MSNLLNVGANLRAVTRSKAVSPTHFLCTRYPHPKSRVSGKGLTNAHAGSKSGVSHLRNLSYTKIIFLSEKQLVPRKRFRRYEAIFFLPFVPINRFIWYKIMEIVSTYVTLADSCKEFVPFDGLGPCEILEISPLWTFSGDGRSRTAVQTSHQIAFYTFIRPLIVGPGLPDGGLT